MEIVLACGYWKGINFSYTINEGMTIDIQVLGKQSECGGIRWDLEYSWL